VCGKRIRATYKGKSCEVTVVDRCEACKLDDLDFTITAFEKLGSKDEGRLHGMTVSIPFFALIFWLNIFVKS
jgi:hypothetical protein